MVSIGDSGTEDKPKCGRWKRAYTSLRGELAYHTFIVRPRVYSRRTGMKLTQHL